MRIIREVRNALDGKYHIVENEKDEKKTAKSAGGFRGDDSRVVRKLLDLGIAIPQNGERKNEKRS